MDEGSTVALFGTGTDPEEAANLLTLEWDLDGDGIFAETGVDASMGDELGISPTFDAFSLDGPTTRTVSLRVTDSQGASSTDQATVNVLNVAPSVSSTGDTIEEGQVAIISGTISDPAFADSLTAVIEWGDGTSDTFNYAAGTTAFSEAHTYSDDDPTVTPADDYSVTVTVIDDDGESGEAVTTVRVLNVPPMVDAGPNATLALGVSFVLSAASFSDVGVLDTHTATIDWGDGGVEAGVVTEVSGSGAVAGSHTYGSEGTFTVTVTVTDDDGGLGSDTLLVTVATFTTDARFMTGGGNVSIGQGKDAHRYTWGFVLRCDGSGGNFQFNDHSNGGAFHLESITSVECNDDLSVDPGNPKAGFDTLVMEGQGRWNGTSGATVHVTLVDAGEPGKTDTIEIEIHDADGVLVDVIPASLTGGNHQAHAG